jgi:DNA-binding transcriptional LysR family regulator
MLFPTWLLLGCLERFGKESPGTQIELSESVLGHRTDALAKREADLAIFAMLPAGFLGETLMRVRFVMAAHPDHPLHKLGRKLTPRDFRPYRHLVVRETSPARTGELSMRATQRWTVGQFSTLIQAANAGYGFAWLPEDKIRPELQAGTLKPLPLEAGSERYADLYLVFADREHAGPGTMRLAEIIREAVGSECLNAAHPSQANNRAQRKRKVNA